MCFSKETGPMKPGSIVVETKNRLLDECVRLNTVVHDENARRGVVMCTNWDNFSCEVVWSDGTAETMAFKDVDVVIWDLDPSNFG